MKLLSCHIDNFGILSNFDYTFKSELNVFYEENGFGKTTFMSFIKAMFYGLKKNERKQYFPWQGGNFGGTLSFSSEGETYEIQRTFFENEEKDITNVTNKNGKQIKGGQIGAKIFGLNEDAFERTAYLMERGDSAMYDKVKNNLTSLVESGEDAKQYERAIETLSEELAQLEGKKGEIITLNARLNKVEKSLQDAEAIEAEFVENKKVLDTIDGDIEQRKLRIRNIETEEKLQYEQNARIHVIKEYNDKLERIEEKENSLAVTLRFFNGQNVSNINTNEYNSLLDDIKGVEYYLKQVRDELKREEKKSTNDNTDNKTVANSAKNTVKTYNMAVNNDDKVTMKVENQRFDSSISGEQLKKNQDVKNRLTLIRQNHATPKYNPDASEEKRFAPSKKITPSEALEKVSPDLRNKYSVSTEILATPDSKVVSPKPRPDVAKLKNDIIARQTTVTTTISPEKGAKYTRPNWLTAVPHPGLVGKTAVSKIDEGTLKLRKESYEISANIATLKKFMGFLAIGLSAIIAISVFISILALADAMPASFTITLLSVFIFTAGAIGAIFVLLIFEIKKKKRAIGVLEDKIKKIAGEITKNYENISKEEAAKNLELFIQAKKNEEATKPQINAPSSFVPQGLSSENIGFVPQGLSSGNVEFVPQGLSSGNVEFVPQGLSSENGTVVRGHESGYSIGVTPNLGSENDPILASENEPILSENINNIISENEPSWGSENEPILASENEPILSEKNGTESAINNASAQANSTVSLSFTGQEIGFDNTFTQGQNAVIFETMTSSDTLDEEKRKESARIAEKIAELREKENALLLELSEKKLRLKTFLELFSFAEDYKENYSFALSAVTKNLERFDAITTEISLLKNDAETFRIQEGISASELDENQENEIVFQSLTSQKELLQSEVTSLLEKKADSSAFIKLYFRKPSKLEDLRGEKHYLEFELSKMRARSEEIKSAILALKKSKETLVEKHLPKAKDEFTTLVTGMLNFDDVVLDDALNIKISDNGSLRDLSSYSEGYKTIFDFCRRVALSKLVFSQTSGFLIMDDPFVMLDEKHFSEATDVIKTLASDTQVIYFTCHKTRMI